MCAILVFDSIPGEVCFDVLQYMSLLNHSFPAAVYISTPKRTVRTQICAVKDLDSVARLTSTAFDHCFTRVCGHINGHPSSQIDRGGLSLQCNAYVRPWDIRVVDDYERTNALKQISTVGPALPKVVKTYDVA